MALVRLWGGERRLPLTASGHASVCFGRRDARGGGEGWVALVLKTRSRIYLLLLIQLMPDRPLAVAVVVILIPFHYLGYQKKKKRINGANLIKS